VCALGFADDIALSATSTAELQILLNIAGAFAKEFKLEFNLKKCGHMQLHGPPASTVFTIPDAGLVPTAALYTYLGARFKAPSLNENCEWGEALATRRIDDILGSVLEARKNAASAAEATFTETCEAMHLPASFRESLFPGYVGAVLEFALCAFSLRKAQLRLLEDHYLHLWTRAGCKGVPPPFEDRWRSRRVGFLHGLAGGPPGSFRRAIVDRLSLSERMGLARG
jgi:hypothetical protein